MKRIILFISLLGIAAVACNTLDEPNLTEVHELTVSLPKIDSNVMYWKNGDVISAGTNTMSAPLAGVPSRTSSTVFTFEKPVTSGAIVRFLLLVNHHPYLFLRRLVLLPHRWVQRHSLYMALWR